MIVTPIQTSRLTAGSISLLRLLDESLPELAEGSVLAITSKIISLCENNVVPIKDTDKETLIEQEADFYTEPLGTYRFHFTVTNHTLIAAAGIDESNGDDNYVLWPKNAQKTANEVRAYLQKRFDIRDVGVVITDSTCMPLRLGTHGIAIAHSGFDALNNYVGQPDLFGRPFTVSRSNIAEGLAASAVLTMGEGTEQTPLCILSDLPFVMFQDRDPSPAELEMQRIPIEEDIFAPFIQAVDWKKGQRTT